LFPDKHRWGLAGVFMASVAAAAFETLGVASILPFMALVLDPSVLSRSPVVMRLLTTMGIVEAKTALLTVGIATVFTVGLGNLAAIANLYIQQVFAGHFEARLTSDLFAGYMQRPYAFHVQRDAPSLLKVLNSDVRAVIDGLFIPALNAASRALVILLVLAFLIWQDPSVALGVGAALSAMYVVVFWLVRRRQRVSGHAFNEANDLRSRISQEGLGGIKELLVLGRVTSSIELYGESATVAANSRAMAVFVGQLPRYLIETISFGAILVATLALIAFSGRSTSTVVPQLALYAFAGYKLLPAFQALFYAAVSIRFYAPAFLSLHRDLTSGPPERSAASSPPDSADRLMFQDRLTLQDVSFTYPGASRAALGPLALQICPRESIGLVGRSGAGKSTLADLILGLYPPTTGQILVDRQVVEGGTLRRWQKCVGYVPQQVFLANASITANIALGIRASDVDMESVVRAARLAQADSFIAELPRGYDTVIGERGVRLSGGQRQRLGIARALYHRPSVLVFDEATSALDGLTEDLVMEAITTLSKELTIILVAHRLRTIEACDRVVLLDEGKIIAEGSYDELKSTSPDFQRMIRRIDQSNDPH
jgi:ABC-type multidrug transport system fused ATPase/permease subunit